MYNNREAILKEFGSELMDIEDTVQTLQQNGPWFCFLLMAVLGIQLGKYLVLTVDQEDQGEFDLTEFEATDIFDLAKIFARDLESGPVGHS